MININTLKAVATMSLDFLVVEWNIDDTVEPLRNYRYDIYRCVGADNEEEYELIGAVAGDSFDFLDTNAPQHKRGIHFYYIVVPVYIPTNQHGEPKKCISFFDNTFDVYANYIKYVNNAYLNVINNHPGCILIKRRFGQRCSKCWDDIRRQHRQHGCPNCFGTGYEGGYHSPKIIRFGHMSQYPASSENVTLDGRGDNTQDVTIWTESYPIISVGDIFVDSNNNRFKVNHVQKTTKNNHFILRQVLNMQLLSTSDPAYDIIIDIGGDTNE